MVRLRSPGRFGFREVANVGARVKGGHGCEGNF